MDQKIHTAINWLDHDQVVTLLEGNGMACLDDETTNDLRETLRQCIEDGDIEPEALSTLE